MESLASILAGGGANPYQQPQGIAPLLSQLLLAHQMAPGQIGQGQPQPGGMIPGSAAPPQAQGLGGMGAAQMPQGMPGGAALPFLLGS
jgi:hypothetical protein